MTMRPVAGIDVPAKGTVQLEPGGYHIMLIDLVAPLTKGQTFELTLTFQHAGAKTVTATVRDA
jgi:copper(I)-binding protein